MGSFSETLGLGLALGLGLGLGPKVPLLLMLDTKHF